MPSIPCWKAPKNSTACNLTVWKMSITLRWEDSYGPEMNKKSSYISTVDLRKDVEISLITGLDRGHKTRLSRSRPATLMASVSRSTVYRTLAAKTSMKKLVHNRLRKTFLWPMTARSSQAACKLLLKIVMVKARNSVKNQLKTKKRPLCITERWQRHRCWIR